MKKKLGVISNAKDKDIQSKIDYRVQKKIFSKYSRQEKKRIETAKDIESKLL